MKKQEKFFHNAESVKLELPFLFTALFLLYFAYVSGFDFFISIISVSAWAFFLSRLLKIASKKTNETMLKDLGHEKSRLYQLYRLEFLGLSLQAFFFFVLFSVFRLGLVYGQPNQLLEYSFIFGLVAFSAYFSSFFAHHTKKALETIVKVPKAKATFLEVNSGYLFQSFLIIVLSALIWAVYFQLFQEAGLRQALLQAGLPSIIAGLIGTTLLFIFSVANTKAEASAMILGRSASA